jgi:biopolymer transport protein ExbD
MAKKRMLLFRKRGKRSEGEIELTSLIDIVTILLVFLLINSGAGEFDVKLVSGVELPSTSSVNGAKRGITVQFNKDGDIYLEDELVTSVKNGWSDQNRRVFNEKFKNLKDELETVWKNNNNSEKFHLMVNFVLDKSIAFLNIDQMMKICQYHGMLQYKFIANIK